MKKVSLLIFVSLILLLAFASCQFFGGGHEHEWSDATCSTPKTCLGCGETEGEALGHDWTAATCTSPATCKICEATEGTALGHQWRDATCTVSKTCLVCNETEGAPLGHKNDIVLPAEAATCTKTGLTEGVKCSACQTITTPQETVPKTAHTEETVPGKAASCTDTGLSDGKKCTVCGTVTVEQEILPMVSHSEETLPAKAPTCTEDGLKEGKKCTVCGTVTVVQEKVPATGHKNTTKYDKEEPTCTEDGLSAGEYCNDCQTWLTEREVLEAPGHEERATPIVTRNEPSCTAEGSIITEYKCKFCGETVRSTSEPIEKIPHNWGEYSYNEDATCGVDGTKTATCTYGCGTPNTITAEGTALVHTAPDDAVCGEEWTCKYCNEYKEILAHDYADATCLVLATCKKCGATTGELADCVPGTPVEEDRVEPKCGVEGSYNEVVYCTVCNEKLSSTPKSIAALEHVMGEATCKEPATCTREECTYTEGEPRDNHNVKMSYSNGELKYYCASGCDDVVFTVETEKLVYDGSAAPGYTFNANGNMPVSYANGYYEYIFTPTGDKPTEAAAGNGWGYNGNSKLHGAQPMFWIPTNDGTKDVVFDGFSCENNAFGVISFKLKTSMTSNYTVAIAKNRNPENKTEFPSSSFNDWGHSSINILTIGAVNEGANSIEIRGGLDGSNYAMGTIPVVDGWSEWFEVKLFIYLKDNNTITVGYYINDEFYGSYVRDLVNPDGKNTIDSLDVRALYINGWTYEPGTGLALDDIAFGYTTDSEWHFDECAHNFTTKTVAPGCETEGYTTYSCSICGLVENRDFTDATGHEITHVDAKAPTCIAVGWEAYDKCENCDYTTYVELGMVDHTPGAAVEENRTEATCIADGKYDSVVYCTVDGCGKELSRETITIKCTGHLDTDRVVPGTAATCTNTGLGEGEYCDVCKTWIKNQDVLPTIDHTPEVVPGKAATCTETGLTEGSKCSVCDKILTEQTEISTIDHTPELVPGTAATCIKTGLTDGYKCSVCGKTLEAQVEIPVVAHTYDDDQDADCNVCGATRDVACLHENIVAAGEAKDATCKETGLTAGEKCADCGEVLTAQEVIEKLPHTVVVDAAVDATCSATGLTEGKHCSVCDEVIVKQEVVAKLAHTVVVDAAVAPSCTETGLTEGSHCSECDEVIKEQSVVSALGHLNDVALAEKAPTCTETGLTAGVKCSRCGVETTPQTVLDALGHTWVDATCDAAKTCSVCGVTDGDPLPSHTLSNTLVDGKLVYECDTCDKSFAITHTQYYTDGSGLSGFTFNDPKTNASYVGDTNAPEAITVDGNTYYQFLRDEVLNTARPDLGNNVKATGQATMWIPNYHNSANPGLKNLSAADGSILLVSFDVDFAMSKNLTLNLVYGAPSTGETWYESSLGKIMEAPINFYSQTDAEGNYTSVRLYGWNNTVIVEKTFAADGVFTAFGSTGWFNVQLAVEFDAANDMLIGHYYIDGAYVTTQCVENTLENNMITAVQFDGTSEPVNSGYRFDNFAVGYTNGAEWTLDTCEHNYSIIGETVAPTCDDDGYTPYTCELCGHVENRDFVAATGHSAPAATCLDASVCTVCGETVAPANGHTLTQTYANSKVTYGCSDCDTKYVIEKGYYDDGTAYNAIGGNGENDACGFTVDDAGRPAIVTDETTQNKYYALIKEHAGTIDVEDGSNNDTCGTGFKEQGQAWLPKDGANNLVDFNAATNSTGLISFKFNAYTTANLTMQLVDSIYGDNDASGTRIRWKPEWCLADHFLVVTPPTDGVVTVQGWGPTSGKVALKTVNVTEDDKWTGWFDVKILVTYNAAADTITLTYYIDGKYVAEGTRSLTTQDNGINSIYVNMNSSEIGSGWMMDDLAFGYTKDGHWMLDDEAHDFTPATCSAPASCSCGWTGVFLADHNIGAPTYDAATNTVAYKCSTCNTVCNMTGYYFDGNSNMGAFTANGDGFTTNGVKADGYYEYLLSNADSMYNATKGDQYMHWFPSASHPAIMEGFSCANNATGIVSFKINSYTTTDGLQ